MNNSKTFLKKFTYKGLDCVMKTVVFPATKLQPRERYSHVAICEDLDIRTRSHDTHTAAMQELKKLVDESIKDRDNSKENLMSNNLEAKKLAIIKSNAAPEVKLKALEKLNAQSNKPTRAEFDSLVNLLAKKLIMQKASAPLPKQQKASDAFLMKLRSFEKQHGEISSPDMEILQKHAERLAKSAIISGAGKDF